MSNSDIHQNTKCCLQAPKIVHTPCLALQCLRKAFTGMQCGDHTHHGRPTMGILYQQIDIESSRGGTQCKSSTPWLQVCAEQHMQSPGLLLDFTHLLLMAFDKSHFQGLMEWFFKFPAQARQHRFFCVFKGLSFNCRAKLICSHKCNWGKIMVMMMLLCNLGAIAIAHD